MEMDGREGESGKGLLEDLMLEAIRTASEEIVGEGLKLLRAVRLEPGERVRAMAGLAERDEGENGNGGAEDEDGPE